MVSTAEDNLFKLLKNFRITKAAEIDQILEEFLKNGARILAKPISELCSLSIVLISFPDAWKFVKLKTRFEKGLKRDPWNYRLLSLLPLLSKFFERIALDETDIYKDIYSKKKSYMTINLVSERTTQQMFAFHFELKKF